MLLRQEATDGVELLSAWGPVAEQDADTLVAAVEHALALDPRGVVVDLREVSDVTERGEQRLQALCALRTGWPRPALVVCPPSEVVRLPGLDTAASRDEALARLDHRPARARACIAVAHSMEGPREARAAAAQCADDLGIGDVRDDLLLVVSEMVTNAVRHASPPIALELEADADDVVVAVCDGSPARPAARAADDDAEGGRGLMLVELLSDEHGVRAHPPGKTVWARLRRDGAKRS